MSYSRTTDLSKEDFLGSNMRSLVRISRGGFVDLLVEGGGSEEMLDIYAWLMESDSFFHFQERNKKAKVSIMVERSTVSRRRKRIWMEREVRTREIEEYFKERGYECYRSVDEGNVGVVYRRITEDRGFKGAVRLIEKEDERILELCGREDLKGKNLSKFQDICRDFNMSTAVHKNWLEFTAIKFKSPAKLISKEEVSVYDRTFGAKRPEFVYMIDGAFQKEVDESFWMM